MVANKQSSPQALFQHERTCLQALALKDKLPDMAQDEQLELLAADGMLVKRPILIGKDFVLAGFRPAEWETAFQHSKE